MRRKQLRRELRYMPNRSLNFELKTLLKATKDTRARALQNLEAVKLDLKSTKELASFKGQATE